MAGSASASRDGGLFRSGSAAPRPAASLSFTDAQRAAAVLEDAAEKLAFLRSVEPDVLTHKEELSAAMGDEVERVMKRQTELEERYRDLLDERASLQGVVTKKQRLVAIGVELSEVDRELKDVTKSLSRALKDNPRVGDNLRKMVSERDMVLELVRAAVKELRSGSGMLGPIETFVRDEQVARQMLEGLKEEEEALTASVDGLRTRMLAERERHTAAMDDLAGKIAAAKTQVRASKDRTRAVAAADGARAAAATEAHARSLALAEARLREDVATLEAKRSVEDGSHAQAAGQLASEQAALAARVEADSARLIEATGDASTRVEDLQRRRADNRERLTRLMERWEQETERERLEAEAQRRTEIQRRRAKAEAQRRARAAEALRTMLPDAFVLVKAYAPKKKGKKGKKKR